MLFLCVLPVSYAIVWLEPSCHCGPFSQHERIYYLLTDTMEKLLPGVFFLFKYIASPAAIIPLLLLLILIIYYLISLTSSLREANQDLKIQLRKERTEERKKMMKLVVNQPEPTSNAISARWKKVMEGSQTVTSNSTTGENPDGTKISNRKDMLACIMKKALRKGSATSDDDSINMPPMYDDGTDSEQHESLPHDQINQMKKNVKRVRTKPEQTNQTANENVTKPKDILNHHPKSKFRVTTVDETKPNNEQDNEEDEKIRIVAERRSSLLRRQNELNLKKIDNKAITPDQDIQNNMKAKKAAIVKNIILNSKKDKKNDEPIYAVSSKQQKVDNVKREGEHESSTAADDSKFEQKALAKDRGKDKIGSLMNLAKEAALAKRNEMGESFHPQQINAATSPMEHVSKLRKERRPKVSIPKDNNKTSKRDSISSIWSSENIPVIKISKTESDECILESCKDEKKTIQADDVASTVAATENKDQSPTEEKQKPPPQDEENS